MDLVTVATCNLNQWALDFDGNLDRIRRSIEEAKSKGAKYRLGPELEVCGYGCEDHYLEQDTFEHCNESLADLLKDDTTDGILCDIGMPVLHHNVRYNCRVFCLNRKILLIRPKVTLADDGNYRESRHFTTWKRLNQLEDHTLPAILQEVTGQTVVQFGQGAIRLANTIVAAETCEELWSPLSAHINQCLSGAEIIGNGSGSHHQLRKLDIRLSYMTNATVKCGGLYLYANQQGCDGARLYYDGSAMIVCNGEVLAQASQFSLQDVEVVVATVSLEAIRSKRAAMMSLQEQSSDTPRMATVREMDFSLAIDGPLALVKAPTLPQYLHKSVQLQTQCLANGDVVKVAKTVGKNAVLSGERKLINGCYYHTPVEECALGPACYLWDYLRRSGASGFFLPLSGGADSSSVAAIVGIMCQLVFEEVQNDNAEVLADLRNVVCEQDFTPANPQEIANRILHTCYMGKRDVSGLNTQRRAELLARQIGAYHNLLWIDSAFSGVLTIFQEMTQRLPKFKNQGGTDAEDLALQNIQARIRMVLAYLLAQLLPWVRGRPGFLLVLGSANVAEGLRGYMTKYDCSSADINPIGSISKLDLKNLMVWAAKRFKYSALAEVEAAPPTAELRPNENESKEAEHTQLDEDDMGMTYQELDTFGRLRQIGRCGPVSMFRQLCHMWSHLSPSEVAVKVKRFFKFYSINRHKMTTITPAYHAEMYSPDDNRFDHRQFLYNTRWPRQFGKMDELVESIEQAQKETNIPTPPVNL